MTSEHTPGPWRGDYEVKGPHSPIDIYAGTNTAIANVSVQEPSGCANARLIAAAPDTAAERDSLKAANAELLEALEDAAKNCMACAGTGEEVLEIETEYAGHNQVRDRQPCVHCKPIRAAIAKAKPPLPPPPSSEDLAQTCKRKE